MLNLGTSWISESIEAIMLKAGCAMLSRPTGLGASCQADADGQKREETLPID